LSLPSSLAGGNERRGTHRYWYLETSVRASRSSWARATSRQALAEKLGKLASSAPVDEAIKKAEAIILAVWFDAEKKLIEDDASALCREVVGGGFVRTIPEDQSYGEIIAKMLPPLAHFLKLFGSLPGEKLGEMSRAVPAPYSSTRQTTRSLHRSQTHL
jgi:predicted dinucleotide-binding enzyme